MAEYTGPFPKTITGSTYTGVEVDNQTFTGDLSNAGTLSGATTGISLVNSTITGAILDSGIIAPNGQRHRHLNRQLQQNYRDQCSA